MPSAATPVLQYQKWQRVLSTQHSVLSISLGERSEWMLGLIGWLLFLCGVAVLIGTLLVYRELAARRFGRRDVYLVRGLLCGVGLLLVWAALVRGAGPLVGLLGVCAQIAAAVVTVREVERTGRDRTR